MSWPHKFLFGDERSDGFILIAVLWILAALAGLAAVYALYVRETAYAFVNHDEHLETQAVALAGVELAAYQLTANPKVRPLSGIFSFRLGKAQVTVEFRSENARIDLNLAPKEVLAGLFAGLGATPAQAENYADRIAAWRTPLTAGAPDNETPLYRSAGKNYGPRHGPFQHVNELGLVLGLPPEFVDHALPFLTVYSGQAEVNVLNAAPEVLAALPGITAERLHVLLSQREAAPQDVLKAQLGTGAQYVTVQASNSNRVTVDVQYGDNGHARSEAVILLIDGLSEPYLMLSWRDINAEPLANERAHMSMQ